MMNNKGQSLVLFVLLLPLLVGIMALVIDVGITLNKKNELENVIEFVLESSLDKGYEEEKIEKLLAYNLDNDDSEVAVKDGVIYIESKAYVEGIFSKILSFNGFRIESSYNGYLKDNRKVIEKIK